MASIGKLRRRDDARGEWVTINEEGEPFQVEIRPLGAAYYDREHELRAQSVARLNRSGGRNGSKFITSDTLPPSEVNRAMADAINEMVLLGVAGLEDDDGNAVTLEQFKELLIDPNYSSVVVMIYSAATLLSMNSEAIKKAASGNLPAASAGS